MLIVLIIVAIVIFINYFLGFKLYKEPKNKAYFNNVNNINTVKMPEIAPDPKYILIITLLCGIAIGFFIALVDKIGESGMYSFFFAVIIGVLYTIEISKRIKVSESSLIYSKAFSRTKEIPLSEIKGIYIYSLSKKFMKRHMLTTKLVVTTNSGTKKFSISSLSKPAVLNIIKNNFGVTDYKIFVASNN